MNRQRMRITPITRRLAALCMALCLLPLGAAATQAAPQADLPVRLFSAGERAASLHQAALSGDTLAVSGRIDAGQGAFTDALWCIDTTTDTGTLLYEAQQGMRILTLVYADEQLYWVEAREGDPSGWRICAWDVKKQRAVSVREDPYSGGTLVPALFSAGTRVYWYESNAKPPAKPPYQRLQYRLHSHAPGEKAPTLHTSAIAVRDGRPPHVFEDVLTLASYFNNSWQLRRQQLRGDAEILLPLAEMPLDVQSNGQYIAWRQSGLDDMAETNTEPGAEADANLGSQLWLMELSAPGKKVCVDTQVASLLLLPEGAYYVNEAGVLCFYCIALGQVLHLTEHSDYLPTLCVQGDRLAALRAIDDGEAASYRAALIDVSALQAEGWPPLQ